MGDDPARAARGETARSDEEQGAEPERARPPSSPAARSGIERTLSGSALEATQLLSEEPSAAGSEVRSSQAATRTEPTSLAFDKTVALSESGPGTGAPAVATQPSLNPEAEPDSFEPFGPYSKLEVLAEQGSIGLVARGYNDAFGRWELLKFLRAELSFDAEIARQFKREGRVLAQLSHPNVVQVFATYETLRGTCLAMEFLKGESLAGHVRSAGGRLDVERSRELMLEAARGLSASHEVGLLHRDIKPENLFVTSAGRGRTFGLKLIDFGLATADRARRDSIGSDPTLISATLGGTPLFMAPELWLGQDASPASDLFALGVSFYWALTGSYPFGDTTLGGVRKRALDATPFQSIKSARPDLPPALGAIIDRAIQKRIDARFQSADELVSAIVAAASATRPRKVPGAGPYRGLEPFSAAERDMFFGRDREIVEVCERLRTQSAVVLVGPSGSGKSSLALAGVAPAVEDGFLGGGITFRTVSVEPRADPLRSLGTALASALGASKDDVIGLVQKEPRRLGEALREALQEPAGLLVVVDQLEELATNTADSADMTRFATALASLVDVTTPGIRVVLTVRADLMDRLFVIEPLRNLLMRGFYPVRPLLGDSLRRALEEPARAAGYELEDPRIAQTIVDDVARTPAGLPLLSFAMAAWWRARDEAKKLLPSAAWQALGGLAGALAGHADDVLDGMGPEERASAQQILVRLVTTERTRAVVSRASLIDPAVSGTAGGRAVERMLQAKLLIESGGDVELVHDALISSWPRLKMLLESSGADRAFRERVAAGAREWIAQSRPDGALWDGEQATRLLRWFEATDAPLAQEELEFVTSVRRRAARRRFFVRSLIAAAVLLTAVLALVFKTSERRLAARLEKTRDEAAFARKTYVDDAQRLLRRLAELEIEKDPGAALRSALQSRELGQKAGLDPIGWHASMAGVARALPPHPEGVAFVVFDPRGKRIATGGRNGELRLLAVDGPASVAQQPAAARPRSASFSPDARWLAVGDIRGELALVDASSGIVKSLGRCGGSARSIVWRNTQSLLARCGAGDGSTPTRLLEYAVPAGTERPIFSGRTAALALSPDATLAAVVTNDAELELLDTRAAKSVRSKAGASVRAVAFARDGKKVALGDLRGFIAVSELKPNGGIAPPTWRATPHLVAIEHLEAAPDGERWVSFDGAGRAVLWNAELTPLATLEAHAPLAWIPARRALALTGNRHEVLVVSVDTGRLLGRLAGSTGALVSIAVDPDARWLVAGSRDGGVRAFSLTAASARVVHGPASTGERCAAASDASAILCLAGTRLRVTPTDGNAPREMDVPAGSIRADGAVMELSVGSRARAFAWLAGGGSLTRIDDTTPSSFEGPETRALLAFDHRGDTLAVTGSRKGNQPLLRLFGSKGRPGAPIAAPGRAAMALSFSADDARLAVALEDGEVRLYDTASGMLVEKLRPLEQNPALGVAFSRDAGPIAAFDAEGRIVTVPIGGGASKTVHRAHTTLGCLAWSVGGRALIAGSGEGAIFVVDTETESTLPVLDAGAGVISCARNTGDDRFLFVTRDGMIYERELSLDPVWMQRKPDEPLDATTHSVLAWQGLEEREGIGRPGR